MTPKQKAFSLYFKYCREVTSDHIKAKKCALIAVTEIINAIAFDFENPSENTIYWLKIKQEIENYGK